MSSVICDGPECAYRRATLPGSREYAGSTFPVADIKQDKELLEALIAKLGASCGVSCGNAGAPSLAECEATCRAHKIGEAKAALAKINAQRSENAAAVKADRERRASDRRYESGTSSGTLDSPPTAFMDVNELHCSVSARTRAVCSLCGGGRAYRARGYHLEVMSPREQRYVPSYPFSTTEEQAAVRSVIKATAPDAITTLALAGHGEMTCLSSSPPPMVADALRQVGVNVSEAFFMRGMMPREQLRWTPVYAITVDHKGRRDISVPGISVPVKGKERDGRGDRTGDEEGGFPGGTGWQAVNVLWSESRDPGATPTEVVPFLAISDAVGVMSVRVPSSSFTETRVYINGSLLLGGHGDSEPIAAPVIAEQADGAEYGYVTGRVPGAVLVSDILHGFGCAKEARLQGGMYANCDPIPQAAPELVRDRLNALGWANATLKGGRISSSYDAAGEGRVFHRVRGFVSVCEECESHVSATFSRPRGPTGPAQMHTVWEVRFHPGSSMSVADVVRLLVGTQPPPELAVLPLEAPAVLLASTEIDARRIPALLPMATAVKAGVNLQTTLALPTDRAPTSDAERLLVGLLGTGARVQLQGLVGDDEVWLLGEAGAVSLSGGARMIDSVVRIVLRSARGASRPGTGALEVGFQGGVLLPVSATDSLRLEGYLSLDLAPSTNVDAAGIPSASSDAIQARRPRLRLVASPPTPVLDAFGVNGLHLSFVVVRQPLYGAAAALYIADAVLSLGAACSADNLDVPGACRSGKATVVFNPRDPEGGLLAGRIGGLNLGELLAFAGVGRGAWTGLRNKLVNEARFPYGATVAYAHVDHFWKSSEPLLSPHSPRGAFAVPSGLSGQGTMTVLGENASATFFADLRRGNLKVVATLDQVSVGGVVLRRQPGKAGGPVVKVAGGVLQNGVDAWIEAFLEVGRFGSYILLNVSDAGLDGATVGRFGEGLHASLRLTADWGVARWMRYALQGHATAQGRAELESALPEQIHKACAANEYCRVHRLPHVQGTGWLQICRLNFAVTAEPDSRPEVAELPDVTVSLLLHRRRKDLTLPRQNLGDWVTLVTAVAQATVQAMVGHDTFPHIWGSQTCVPALEDFRAHVLPAGEETPPAYRIPDATELRTMAQLDNRDAGLREWDRTAWRQRQRTIRSERQSALQAAQGLQRAAWEYDRDVRLAVEWPGAQEPSWIAPHVGTWRDSPARRGEGVYLLDGFGGGLRDAMGSLVMPGALQAERSAEIAGDTRAGARRIAFGAARRLDTARVSAVRGAVAAYRAQQALGRRAVLRQMTRKSFSDSPYAALVRIERTGLSGSRTTVPQNAELWGPQGPRVVEGSRGRARAREKIDEMEAMFGHTGERATKKEEERGRADVGPSQRRFRELEHHEVKGQQGQQEAAKTREGGKVRAEQGILAALDRFAKHVEEQAETELQ